MSPTIVQKVDYRDMVEQLLQRLFGQDWTQLINSVIRPALRNALADAAASNPLTFSIDFDLDNPEVVDWLDQRSSFLVSTINDTTKAQLQRQLSEGYAAGEGVPQLSQRITAVFDSAITHRAELIARTEVAIATNQGLLSLYKQAKVEKKRWLATLDDRVRPTHWAANGQTVGIDEDFQVGGGSGPAPGQIDLAREDIKCRCVVTAVVAAETMQISPPEEQKAVQAPVRKRLLEMRCCTCHTLLAKNISDGEFVCYRCKRPQRKIYIVEEGILVGERPLESQEEHEPAEVVQLHYPGGHDHPQQHHGNRGGFGSISEIKVGDTVDFHSAIPDPDAGELFAFKPYSGTGVVQSFNRDFIRVRTEDPQHRVIDALAVDLRPVGSDGHLTSGKVPEAWKSEFDRMTAGDVAKVAARHNMTPEEYHNAATSHVKGLVDGTSVYVRVPSPALTSILKDGGFKSAFENPNAWSASMNNQKLVYERRLFGYEYDSPASERPIYGYLSKNPTGRLRGGQDGVAQYGEVAIRLKPTVHERTTFALEDATQATVAGWSHALAPAPLKEPDWRVYRPKDDVLRYNDIEKKKSGLLSYNYAEAHIHKGVQVSDIAEVLFRGEPNQYIPDLPGRHPKLDRAAQVQKLDELGVPWRVV